MSLSENYLLNGSGSSQLNGMHDYSHVGCFRIDLRTNQVVWSEELYKIYGFDPKLPPPLLTDSQELFTTESWNLLKTSIAHTITTGELYEVELETINSRDDKGWLWARGEAIRDSEGQIVEIWGVVQNISERKRYKEMLAKSEESYRTLYTNLIEGFALHTLIYNQEGEPIDYKIVDVNPAYEAQLSVTRAEVVNKPSREAYGVEQPPYFELYCKVALTGKPEVFETYFEPMDRYFTISVYSPAYGSFATIFENITERKKSELEHQKMQKLLQDTQRIGRVGGWEMDLVTRRLEWTKEMFDIHELEPTYVPNVNDRQRFYTPESLKAVDEAVENAIQTNGMYEVDLEINTVKGNRRFVKTMGKVELDNHRIYGYFQDISDRKMAELALKESEVKLKELNATKDKFFSIIAHDLRSPFNGILGFSELLKKEVRHLDVQTIEKYSDLIHASALQVFGLLENLLEWSKTQQKGFVLHSNDLLLKKIVQDELECLALSASQKQIALHNDLDKEMVIHADEKMLRTVLRNLISNAIKFTHLNGDVRVSAQVLPTLVSVSVSDSGRGMDVETVEKLFRIEEGFSTRGTENEKGSGLGLLLCREFIEKHGGQLTVQSELGRGSTFTFTLPI